MGGRADPADALDQEYGFLEVLGFGKLLDAPMVVPDLDVQVDHRFAFDVELEELRFFLEGV